MILLLLLLTAAHATTPAESVYDEGFWVIGPDDKMRVGGQGQFDARATESGSSANSTFQVRRARIYATGVLEDKWGYMVMGKWDRGATGLHFAWLESQHVPYARFRIGQFKEPYSLEAVNSDHYFDFDERSIWTANLSQIEDIGAMLYGKVCADRVEYGVGVFNGRGKEKDDTNDNKEMVGQLTVLPLDGLIFSISGARSKLEDDLKNSSYSTAAQTHFLTYTSGVTPSGSKDRSSAELEWLIESASLKGGIHRASFGGLQSGGDTEDAVFMGWTVSASYLVTGEKKLRNRALAPHRIFDPGKGTWGAVEPVLRYEQFSGGQNLIDRRMATGTRKVDSATVGVNWYFNRHVKSLLDFQNSRFTNPISFNGNTISHENTWKIRMQFEF